MEFPKFENLSRRDKKRVEGVKAVIHALTAQVVHEPIPAMSDHYRPAEEPEQPTLF